MCLSTEHGNENSRLWPGGSQDSRCTLSSFGWFPIILHLDKLFHVERDVTGAALKLNLSRSGQKKSKVVRLSTFRLPLGVRVLALACRRVHKA